MKPVFATKDEAIKAIDTNKTYEGCTPIFVSQHYASVHGVEKGGWYLYSTNKLPWCVSR